MTQTWNFIKKNKLVLDENSKEILETWYNDIEYSKILYYLLYKMYFTFDMKIFVILSCNSMKEDALDRGESMGKNNIKATIWKRTLRQRNNSINKPCRNIINTTLRGLCRSHYR